MTDIKNFIIENNLDFTQGSRNSTCTTLIGYSQHLGLSKEQLKEELKDQILEDSFIKEEIDRLWNYCKDRNYKAFWSSEEAKMLWIF